jgi:hypothetical protein
MSAIHLPSEHIAAIVGSYVTRSDRYRFDHLPHTEAMICRMAVGVFYSQILADTNARSVSFRYGEHVDPEMPTPDQLLRYFRSPLNDSQLETAIGSYGYQSCEAPSYEMTSAHQFIEEIRAWIPNRERLVSSSDHWVIQ